MITLLSLVLPRQLLPLRVHSYISQKRENVPERASELQEEQKGPATPTAAAKRNLIQ